MRRGAICSLLLTACLATGCRCCCLLNPYANAVDDVNDTHVYFDNWYNPRLDVSRAGKPDWCGPINSRIGRGISYLGCSQRHDEDHLYPPSHPYAFPGNSLHGPLATELPSANPATPTPTPYETPVAPTPGRVD